MADIAVLDQSNHYDILIVGAGIIGTASAYHLQKNNRDKKILLVDRYQSAAQGNTARSNAMFRNTFTSPDNQILTDTSINFYLELQKTGIDIGLRKTGYLWIMSERQLSSNDRHVRRMLDNGIELHTYGREDLERMIPQLRVCPDDDDARIMELEPIAGAVFGPKCGRLDPDKLANYYLRSFLEMGGRASFNTNAEHLLIRPNKPLDVEGEPFVWQEADVSGARLSGNISGEISADNVVIASGAWNNMLLEEIGIDGHVKAKKRQLFKIRASEGDAIYALIRNEHFNNLKVMPFLILPKSGCFVKAIAENNEFWIGCDDDLGRPYINSPSEDLEDYKAEPEYFEKSVHPILKEYLPDFALERPAQMWAGLYSFNTIDFLPSVFEQNGIIVVGGDSGSGIMKGDAIGRIVDAVYRKGENAGVQLYGGVGYDAGKIGFKSRDIEREEWVI